MKRKFRVGFLATAAGCLTLMAAWGMSANGQEQTLVPRDPATPPKAELPREPTKLPGKVFMSAKLTGTQDVLEGLLTRDFDQIRKAAQSLRDVALTTPPEQVRKEFDAQVYDHFRHEFLRLSGQLDKLAAQENLEGVAFVHQNLNSTCIGCHEFVRDKTLP